MKKLLGAFAVLGVIGAVGFWALTIPQIDSDPSLPEGDAARGEQVFWAGGCASCHAADDAAGDEKLKLGGGHVLASDFGNFVAPNISMHQSDGIGGWSSVQFYNAMKNGVSPTGRHYYPAFPYTSYTRMTNQDLSDLWAFMRTLPEVEGKAASHDLSFPFTLSRGIGLWKLLFLKHGNVTEMAASPDEKIARGAYLVEALGHCGECHTPRNLAGGLALGDWLGGAPNPDGEGTIPNITPSSAGIGSWSEADIAYYLESGFTPEFDSVGGSMVDVQENMAQLPAAEREAIAAYLKSVAPQE